MTVLELAALAAAVLAAAGLALVAYSLCAIAGLADETRRRALEHRGLFDGAAPGARRA